MYKLAFIIGNTTIYWHSIILALAVLTGILLFLSAYLRQSGSLSSAAVTIPIAFILSLMLSRLTFWYFRADRFSGFLTALSDLFGTGHALVGIFAGCVLAACLLRAMGTVQDLPMLLDCMSLGGCAAIALGRLSFFFTPHDRGEILTGFTQLPLVCPVVNSTSGALEYRFATFLFQAIASACILAVLLWRFYSGARKRSRRNGDIALLFLLLHCSTQIVLESTRYDAFHLRSNGFVSAVQVLSAICIAAILVILSIRLIKLGGMGPGLVLRWILTAAGLGCAGYMEYHVQRHGDQALFAYSVMSIALCVAVIMILSVYHGANSRSVRSKHRFLAAE